jgi:iron complex outermembrane receptor protein
MRLISVFLTFTVFSVNAGENLSEIEIIEVQGRKFSEPLFSYPGSVSYLTEDIENNIVNSDLLNGVGELIPNFSFINVTKNQTSLSIRGAFSAEDSAGTDQPISIYVDGVYRGRVSDIQYDFMDFDHIEVLGGPQGTTHGRNSAGGTLNIFTKRPSDEFSGYSQLTLGNYGRANFKARVEGGIENTALKGVVGISRRTSDGWVKNLVTGNKLEQDDQYGFYGALEGDLSKNTAFYFTIDYQKDDSYGVPRHFYGESPLFPGLSNEPKVVQQTEDGLNNRDAKGLLLELSVDDFIEDWELVSVSGYRHNDSLVKDNQFAPSYSKDIFILVDETVTEDLMLSQEFRLSKVVEKSTSLIGVYFSDQESEKLESFDIKAPLGSFAGVIFGTDAIASKVYQNVDTQSTSLFFDYSYRFESGIGVFGGGRYTNDKKTGYTEINGESGSFILPGQPFLTEYSKSWSEFTPRYGLDWKSKNGSDLYVYVLRSRGYTSGGFTAAVTSPDAASIPFAPELAKNFELGVRKYFSTLDILSSIVLFQTKYEDLQTLTLQPSSQGLIQIVANAGKATSQGFEFNLVSKISNDTNLNFSLNYLDATYDDFVIEDFVNGTQNFTGNELPASPPWGLNIGFKHHFNIGGETTYKIYANYSFRDKVYFFPDNAATQLTYDDTDWNIFNVSLSAEFGSWNVGLFVQNILDEQPWTFVNSASSSFYLPPTDLFSGKRINYGTLLPPRAYGFRINYTF